MYFQADVDPSWRWASAAPGRCLHGPPPEPDATTGSAANCAEIRVSHSGGRKISTVSFQKRMVD